RRYWEKMVTGAEMKSYLVVLKCLSLVWRSVTSTCTPNQKLQIIHEKPAQETNAKESSVAKSSKPKPCRRSVNGQVPAPTTVGRLLPIGRGAPYRPMGARSCFGRARLS